MPLAHLSMSPNNGKRFAKAIEVRQLLREAVRADNYEGYEQAIRELEALIDQHPCSSRLRVHLADLVFLQAVCAQGSAADGIPLAVKEALKADPFDPESLETYSFYVDASKQQGSGESASLTLFDSPCDYDDSSPWRFARQAS